MSNTKEETIIEVASDLFQSNSYLSVGIDRIINESSVAKMTFYKYFPSKEILIMTVLERRKDYILSSLDNFVNNSHIHKPKIKLLFLWFKNWFFSKNFYGCMFIKSQEEFPNNLNIKKIHVTYKKSLHCFVKNILLEIYAKDSDKLASFLLILIDGLTIKANLKLLTEEDMDYSWDLFRKQIEL